MKKNRFTDQQIAFALQHAEAGTAMVVRVRFRSPITLSILTVPTTSCQIVECGLSALGMTAVSYVIWEMSD
jgi:hypothetical protein